MVCGFKQKFINCIKESNKNSKSANTSEVKKKIRVENNTRLDNTKVSVNLKTKLLEERKEIT